MIRTITVFALSAMLSLTANGHSPEILNTHSRSYHNSHSSGNQNSLLTGRPETLIPESMLSIRSESNLPLLKLDSMVLASNDWKDKYVYDDLGRLTNQYFMEWDKQFNEWRAYWGMQEFSYRDDGLLAQMTDYTWDFDFGELKELARFMHEYDENKQHISTVVMLFDLSLQDWKKLRQRDYEYDEDGNLVAVYSYGIEHATGNWVHWSKWVYTYNEAGLQESETEYRFNNEQDEYFPLARSEKQYNDLGQIHETFGYSWRAQQEEWVNTSWVEHAYSEDHRLVSKIFHRRDNDGAPLTPRNKERFEYDAYGNPVFNETLQNQLVEWLSMQQFEMVYDHAWQFSDLALPSDYTHFRGQVPTHKMVEFTSRQRQGMQWGNENVFRLFYSDLAISEITLTEDIAKPDLKPYPNPARDMVNIQLPEEVTEARFELYDMTGRLLISRSVSGHDRISLHEIKTGIYIYRIAGPAYERSGKLVRE